MSVFPKLIQRVSVITKKSLAGFSLSLEKLIPKFMGMERTKISENKFSKPILYTPECIPRPT